MKESKLKKFVKYIFVNILAAAILTLLLTNFVASAYKIKGNSMQTVLNDKERIIISKWPVPSRELDRFDIVVLHKPDEPNKSIIKRIIGLPGETIELKAGDVYINTQQLKQPFLNNRKKGLLDININMKPLMIPRDHYFVMGDNRPVSRDSRSFGAVPRNYIYGKSVLRYWPLSRFGRIH